MRWHSAVMLARYARTFRGWADRFEAGPVDRVAVAGALQELRETIDDVIIGSAPLAAEVLVRHSAPEQIDRLKERIAEKMADRREELLTPAEEQAEARVDSIVNNIERLTGDLNEAQLSLVGRYVRSTPGSNARWLENRARRQKAFVDFLSRRPAEAELSDFLIRILLRPHEIVDPEYRDIAERRWVAMEKLMFEVLSTLTAAQRRETISTLRNYAADMQEVAG
jgi:hypothetical protein